MQANQKRHFCFDGNPQVNRAGMNKCRAEGCGPSLTLMYDNSTVQTDFIGADWRVPAGELPIA